MQSAVAPKSEDIKHHSAGVFLVTKSGKVVGQLRDDKPGIDNPGKIGVFGGSLENGEDPLEAAWRELVVEETNLKVSKDELRHLADDIAWRDLTKEWEVRHFYYTYIDDESLSNMEVYEGQGWAYISGADDKNIPESGRQMVSHLFKELKIGL